jgi:Mg2+ and Co2+ transporter CorA
MSGSLAKAADTIRELEDEIWKKELCVKRIMEMNPQLMEFRKVIPAKNKIISELENKAGCPKMA